MTEDEESLIGEDNKEWVKRLIELGVLTEEDEDELYIFDWEITEESEVLELLIEKGLDFKSERAESLLVKAVDKDHFELVQFLIKGGVNLNRKSREYERTILIQSVIDKHTVIVELFIGGGADLNIADGLTGCTALMWSVAQNNLDMTKLLIKGKADLNISRESDGKTALMFSCTGDMAKLLIDAGANIEAKDFLQMTPLMWFQRYENIEVVKTITELQITKMGNHER
jgi:ankyrin repeat protein